MVIEKLCLINHLRGELVNDEPQNQKKEEKLKWLNLQKEKLYDH